MFIGRWVFASTLLVVAGALGLIMPTLVGAQLPPGWYTMSAWMAVVGAPGIAYALAARP